MSTHVTNLCRSSSYALWRISKIRNLLNQNTTEKLIHAFVTSRLDYCNSLLFGLPAYEIRKLQLIQNSAARLITRQKYTHITPILKQLHWLPIHQRAEFKILCLTFKVIHGTAPNYLSQLLSLRSSDRTLRRTSRGEIHLHQPIARTAFYGDRAFSVCSPRLWNALPSSVQSATSFQSFKSGLKTHLFNRTFV